MTSLAGTPCPDKMQPGGQSCCAHQKPVCPKGTLTSVASEDCENNQKLWKCSLSKEACEQESMGNFREISDLRKSCEQISKNSSDSSSGDSPYVQNSPQQGQHPLQHQKPLKSLNSLVSVVKDQDSSKFFSDPVGESQASYMSGSSHKPSEKPSVPLIPACCDSVSSKEVLEFPPQNDLLIPGSSSRDPYYSGSADYVPRSSQQTKEKKWVKGELYHFTPPDHLGGMDEVPKNGLLFEIPVKQANETKEDYNRKRLESLLGSSAKKEDPAQVLTFAGAGSMSDVFYYHPPLPSEGELKRMYSDEQVKNRFSGLPLPEARRKTWAEDHAKEVIKLRKPNPFDRSIEYAGEMLRRDLAVSENIEQLVNGFRYVDQTGAEKKLITVAKYGRNFDEIKKGILRQPSVKGKSAREIGLMLGSSKDSDKQYLIKQFGSIDEAKRVLAALQSSPRNTPLFDQVRNEKSTEGDEK